MAWLSLYYIFSLACLIGTIFFISNLLSIRLRGRAFIGHIYKKESEGHKALLRLARNRTILISSAVFLISVVNIFLAVQRILNESDGLFLVWFMPVFLLVISYYVIKKLKWNFSDNRFGAQKK